MSLGRYAVAAAEDVTAGFVNPAGLAFLVNREVAFEYEKPFLGMKNAGNQIPGYRKVDIGAGFVSAGMPIPAIKGAVSFSYASMGSKNQYTENEYVFCYAARLDDLLLTHKAEKISMGITLKYLNAIYEPDDYTGALFEKYRSSSGGLASDWGVCYLPSARISFGASFLNWISSDLGISHESRPEKIAALGSSYRPFDRLRVSAAYSRRSSYPYDDFHLGSEFVLIHDGFSLLAGANSSEITCGFELMLAGAGNFFRLNYYCAFPLKVEGGYGTHGISVSFGIPDASLSEKIVRR